MPIEDFVTCISDEGWMVHRQDNFHACNQAYRGSDVLARMMAS